MLYSATDKDPNAVLDYIFDWADFLGNDTIATSTFPSFPSGITNVSSSTSTTDVTLWLSGGSEGQDYQITNRITTNSTPARVMDWVLLVRVTQDRLLPLLDGPPYASVRQASAYQAAADGAEPFKVEMVLRDASDIVAHLVPPPDTVKAKLAAAMDTVQTKLTLDNSYFFPENGTVLVDSEVIQYRDKELPASFITGSNDLPNLLRGRNATIPSTHTSGTDVTEIGYPLRALRAELAVFEWLWDTRGYKPSRSGVVGSESYSIGSEVHAIVRQVMGPYYGGEGGVRGTATLATLPRYRYPFDVQSGGYSIR